MSDVIIALLLLVPILVVILILDKSNKKRRRLAQFKIYNYIANALKQSGISDRWQQQLVQQTVILDDESRKLLIVHHNGNDFSHDVVPLDTIKSVRVADQKLSILPVGKGERKENLITKIGVELSFDRAGMEKFLTVYDYVQHNVFQMNEFEKQAHQLQQKIEIAKDGHQSL